MFWQAKDANGPKMKNWNKFRFFCFFLPIFFANWLRYLKQKKQRMKQIEWKIFCSWFSIIFVTLLSLFPGRQMVFNKEKKKKIAKNQQFENKNRRFIKTSQLHLSTSSADRWILFYLLYFQSIVVIWLESNRV